MPDVSCTTMSYLQDEDLAKILTDELGLNLSTQQMRDLLVRVADTRPSLAGARAAG
jgi:hypothetical protein